MLFSYKAVDDKGLVKQGALEANNIKEARNQLAMDRLVVIGLTPLNKGQATPGKAGGLVFGHVSQLEKILLANHLSVMIKSGMSLDDAIETIASNASAVMKKRLGQVLSDIEAGIHLSDALKKYPHDFDMLFVNMIAVGESSGRLSENLHLLAVQQQKSFDLKRKIRAASIYPSIILCAVLMLIIIISIFVLPKIINFFTTLQVELPLPTRILIALASFFIHYWSYIIIGVVLLVLINRIMMLFDASRLVMHKIILHLPLVGKIIKNINLALFARTLGSLLASGITIDRGLQIVARTIPNEVYKREAISIYHNTLKGVAISDSLLASKYFPVIFDRMSKVGEKSGNLSEVLNYIADFYEAEVDNATKNIATVLEPALLLIVGLIVAFVAISIINPIYDLTSKVER